MATGVGALTRRVVYGSVTGALNRVVTLVLWVAITPLILNTIGDEGYAVWVLAGSLASYGYLLDLGMGGAVVKYVAEAWTRHDAFAASRVLSTALAIFSVLGVGCFALGAATAVVFPAIFNIPPDQRAMSQWVVVLIAASVAVTLITTPISLILRGLQRHALYNTIATAATVALIATSALVLIAGGGLLGMVAVNIPVTICAAIAHAVAARRLAPDILASWDRIDRREARRLLSFSSWLFAMTFSGQLQQKTDEVVIALFLPIAAVTPYALARRLGQLAYTFASQFFSVFMPLASELDARADVDRLRDLFLVGTRIILAGFMPIGLVLILLADRILTIWVGSGYQSAAPIVIVLTAAGLVAISVWPAAALLTGIARHRFVGIASLGNGVANILLSVILVQQIGLIGVAVGTLVPTAIEALVLTMPYTMRRLGVGNAEMLSQVWLPVLLPAIPVAIALWVASLALAIDSLIALIVAAIATAIVYGFGYLALPQTRIERRTLSALVAGGLACVSRDARRSRNAA